MASAQTFLATAGSALPPSGESCFTAASALTRVRTADAETAEPRAPSRARAQTGRGTAREALREDSAARALRTATARRVLPARPRVCGVRRRSTVCRRAPPPRLSARTRQRSVAPHLLLAPPARERVRGASRLAPAFARTKWRRVPSSPTANAATPPLAARVVAATARVCGVMRSLHRRPFAP